MKYVILYTYTVFFNMFFYIYFGVNLKEGAIEKQGLNNTSLKLSKRDIYTVN